MTTQQQRPTLDDAIAQLLADIEALPALDDACRTCNGGGRCGTCGGSGTKTGQGGQTEACRTCNGSGDCPTCSGRG